MKTDWFEMREARLHLAPYTDPHFKIAVASTQTPSAMLAAGRHGLAVLSLGAGIPGGPEALSNQWKIAEDEAARHGRVMDRKEWRLVVNMHCAEDDEEAMAEVRKGERIETLSYFEETLGRPAGRADDPLRDGVAMGTTLVGSPDTITKGLNRLIDMSRGGCGGFMFRAHEWANRTATMKSYELFARWVMPRFQGSIDSPAASQRWTQERRKKIFVPSIAAVKKAYDDAGVEAPDDYKMRLLGLLDEDKGDKRG